MHRFFKKVRSDPASGLLLVSSGGIGDTILLSTVLERFTRMALLGECITLVLPAESGKVAFIFHKDVKLILVDYRLFRRSWFYRRKISYQLYTANYRCVISTDFLRHPKLDELVIRYCEAKEAFAMRARPWRKYDAALTKNNELYNQMYNSGPVHLDKILRWSKFADWLNGTNLPPPKVCLPECNITAAQKYLRPTVVLAPFSAVKEKQVSPDIFLEIMEHLKGSYDFVVVGAPGDFDNNPEYLILLEARNITFDASTFEDLAAKLVGVDLVVSVDTAVMHLSVSLGTSTVCLASAAYVNEIVPYSPEITPDNVRFVYKAMKCQGCLGSCCLPLEDDRFPCVARLKPNYILNAIDELLIN